MVGRSIEVRTKNPLSPVAFEYGSAEHPIDLETEVSVSKRRSGDFSDDDNDDEEDDELRSWVGKRVRSRYLND